MFVAKHYQDGKVYICTCDSYEHDTESPTRVDMNHRVNGPTTFYILPGDSVFIENLAGKTVTAIRPRS